MIGFVAAAFIVAVLAGQAWVVARLRQGGDTDGIAPGAPLAVEVRAVDGGLVEVTVRQAFATDVPLVGSLTPDLELVGRATFRQEAAANTARSQG